jgi:hypothetical protein
VPPSSHSASSSASGAATKDVSLYNFFAPGGVLAKTHPAYEFRRGQLQMAQAVEEALDEKRHLIVGSRNWNRQNFSLPSARDSLWQASHHLNWHKELAGTTL